MLVTAAVVMPLYKKFGQPALGINVIPVAAAAVLPVGLWLAWQGGKQGAPFWSVLAGGAVMGVRAAQMWSQMRRRA
ncbi:hypothetical protein ACFP81_07555 [Deinococcus lacus]|uniref:Uncharacterized protein n=1 Tax=Deinococcus lacus TaxID=392561 RepID=A0ABW1YCY6_9DEIO